MVVKGQAMERKMKEMDELILEIESIDKSILSIHRNSGLMGREKSQLLKYRRCFLLDKLTKMMNNMRIDEDYDEWGELQLIVMTNNMDRPGRAGRGHGFKD
jgi:hypothetical protein